MWIYQGKGTWHFITVPQDHSDQIKFFTSPENTGVKKRGWGSVRVTVTIGDTIWQTSIFPSKSSGSYILPIKAEIRQKTKIFASDDVMLTLDVKTGL